jgi:serine/threonine protein kinase
MVSIQTKEMSHFRRCMNPDNHHNALNQNDKLYWYEIKTILGQGGFGITYLARDTNLDHEVAIKEYLPIEFSTRDASNTVQPISENHAKLFNWGKDRFLEEAKTLFQFKHPNIVRVLSFFEYNNTGYIVMEYEEGNDFYDLIKSGENFDEARLLKIIIPILDGLEMVHAQGFIHRDIKPQNIFIRTDGSPVLIDFGSARQALSGQTRTMTSMFSPGYAPFEQYHDSEGKQGPWTDIYSLGATLYCAITGKAPVDALKRSMARLEHNTDAYLELSDIKAGNYSEHFLKAIDSALQFSDKHRPNSVIEWKKMLLGEIEAKLVDANTAIYEAPMQPTVTVKRQPTQTNTEVAPPTSVTKPSTKPDSHSKSGWMVILLLLVIVAAGAVFYFSTQQKPPVVAEVIPDDSTANQTELEKPKAELKEKSGQLEQNELEKLRAELAKKSALLEQAEREAAEKIKLHEITRLKLEAQAKLEADQAAARKAKQIKAAKLAAQQKQAEIERQEALKKEQAELARVTAEDYVNPSGVSKLTEEQLLTNIIGDTLTGKSGGGMKWTEYYEPSKGEERKGDIRGKGFTKLYAGQWKISGSLMCLDYKDDEDDGCWTLALNGNTVTWYKPNGKEYPPSSILIPGNPNDF